MGFHQDFARSSTKVMEFTLLLAEEMQGQPSSSLYSTALLVLVLEHVSLHKSYVAEVLLLMVDLWLVGVQPRNLLICTTVLATQWEHREKSLVENLVTQRVRVKNRFFQISSSQWLEVEFLYNNAL